METIVLAPGGLYTIAEAAAFFKVGLDSVYQSMPNAACRPKLGRRLPEPLRLGGNIRWTGRQLLDFVGLTCEGEPAPISVQPQPAQPMRGRGRPRKAAAAEQGGVA